MRIGVLSAAEAADLKSAHRIGFRSMQWMRFDACPATVDLPGGAASRDSAFTFAKQFAAEAQALGIRISAIGAYYRNPLDPKQTDFARRVLHRAIEVAEHIGVQTVSGF